MPRKRKTIKVSNAQYENLDNGGYECVDGVKDFGSFLVENEEGKTMVCKAFQIGVTYDKDAVIKKFNVRRPDYPKTSEFTKFKQALNKEDWTQKLSYAKRVYTIVIDKVPVKGEQSFSYQSKAGVPYVVYYELKK